LGNFDWQGDHNYCRTPSRSIECGSRLPIPLNKRFQRVETLSKNIPINLQSPLDTNDRPFCVKNIPSGPKIMSCQARSLQYRQRCLPSTLEGSSGICFSSLLSHTKSPKKDTGRKSNSITNNTSLANSGLVSLDTSTLNKKSNTDSKRKTFVTEPNARGTSTCNHQISTISGVDTFRKQLSSEGISEEVTELITSAWREGTLSRYESAWRKWGSWCDRRKIDPIRCSVNYILDFLSDSFTNGLQHSTIAGYRSAISAYHSPIDGLKVGNHPRVTALLEGVFNKRPTQPKSSFIWGVEKVIKYIDTLKNNHDLSEEMLTKS